MIPFPIETERLVIRPLRLDDAADLEQSEDWIREKVDRFERDGGMSEPAQHILLELGFAAQGETIFDGRPYAFFVRRAAARDRL